MAGGAGRDKSLAPEGSAVAIGAGMPYHVASLGYFRVGL